MANHPFSALDNQLTHSHTTVPTLDISVVVPLFNEEESLPELEAWIRNVLIANGWRYEIIFVDDGSKDRSWQVIESLAAANPAVRAVKFRRNYGKSAALNTGFQHARGAVVITMDADLQDSPDEIPELRRMLLEDGFDLVSGWKKKRYDPLTKTIPTKLYNWANRRMSGIALHDFNCGLKAYRFEVIKCIEVYGEMHRYIPVLAKWSGFTRIGEKVVEHRARKYGHTKFGWERFIRGPLDLMSIFFVGRFSKRPMHFFGAMGAFSFFSGFVITCWLIGSKLYAISHGQKFRDVVEQPLFYIALLAIVIGVQLFLAGFLAELIGRNSPIRNWYLVEKEI